MQKEEIVSSPKKKKKKKKHKESDNSNDLLQVKSLLLIQIVYLSPMLKLKTVLNLRKIMKRKIHLKYKKKKHLTIARNTLERTSLKEDMAMKENHGCRNACPF